MTELPSRITLLLDSDDPGASDELLPLVYDELRQLARARILRERPGQTLQATALVHEAFLRVAGDKSSDWGGRSHFFAAAAEAMRRILIEQARRKKRLKHGGEVQQQPVDAVELPIEEPAFDVLALDEALAELEAVDPRARQIVNLRYFVGLTVPETADALAVSANSTTNTSVHRSCSPAIVCCGGCAT